MYEFGFELSLCATLEATTEAVLARQLGGGVADPGGRVLDVVCVEPGPGFAERAAITSRTIPDRAIESPVGAGRARDWTAAFDLPPERARRLVDHAVDVGFFERERRGGREYVRQVARYPEDWFGRIRAVENKPDLGSPGALERQLRTDVSLGLVDEVVLATASHVTGAHRNRIPDAVGLWRFDPDAGDPDAAIEELRAPTPLSPDEPGVELRDRQPGRADVAVVTAAEKARARRRLAERAYGKGWRPDAFPACGTVADRPVAGANGVPYCDHYDRIVDPGTDCGPDCPGREPADPPAVDTDAERARRTPWVADPDGLARRQSELDRFG